MFSFVDSNIPVETIQRLFLETYSMDVLIFFNILGNTLMLYHFHVNEEIQSSKGVSSNGIDVLDFIPNIHIYD